MKTIVQLFDEEAINNLLSVLIFKPSNLVFICDKNQINKKNKYSVSKFLKNKNIKTNINYVYVNSLSISSIIEGFSNVIDKFNDCYFDFTGGKDLILLEAGIFCSENNIPGFYIDIKNKKFIEVFACSHLKKQFRLPEFCIEDVLILSGGEYGGGGHFAPKYDDEEMIENILKVWEIVSKNTLKWSRAISFFQCVNKDYSLKVNGKSITVNKQGNILRCPDDILKELFKLNIIENLKLGEQNFSFNYKNEIYKNLLTSQGIWLELKSYIMAVKSNYFTDVKSSVLIDWDGESDDPNDTKNEIDLMVTKGVTPVFISCKMSVPSPLALNEIKLLSKKFGGKYSKTVLITGATLDYRNDSIYKRAKELDVLLFDMSDIKKGDIFEKNKQYYLSEKHDRISIYINFMKDKE